MPITVVKAAFGLSRVRNAVVFLVLSVVVRADLIFCWDRGPSRVRNAVVFLVLSVVVRAVLIFCWDRCISEPTSFTCANLKHRSSSVH